ncbi:unnamed protein product [Linum tenue]|uniref:chorismate mutase n=1 Tax=Linum tenue TaxID=586396 RepID=A0AAV0HQU3_9ROSI|nr:unnamed protein product [Linum tenue]
MESKLLMSGSDYYSVRVIHVINQLVSITRIISRRVMRDLIQVCVWCLTTSLHAPSNESQLIDLKFAQALARVWCLTTFLHSSKLRRCVIPGSRITSSASGTVFSRALGGRVSFGPRGITSSAAGTLPGRVSLGPRRISTALICSASSGKGRFMSSAAGTDKEYGNTINLETFRTSSDFLNLESISRSLICQEDSTIYCLLERAQYCYNAFIYEADAFAEDGLEGSLLEHVVKESEMFHAKLGRFESASELPFFPKELPDMFLPPNQYVIIDVNHKMWDAYFQNLLPNLVKEGSDGFYASSAVRDANCLLAISKRVHTGRFLAESKFTANTKDYTAAIKAQASLYNNKLQWTRKL